MRALVVGAGCCGASAARRLAELGWRVTVAERRRHVGGNAFDCKDERGYLHHPYGPHFFFTGEEAVWRFLTSLVPWVPFSPDVEVQLGGRRYPMPFQPATIRGLLPERGEEVLSALERRWGGRGWVTVLELMGAKEPLLRLAGERLYREDCLPYNQKQWGLAPEALSPEVIARSPVYLRDRVSFREEPFQGLPEGGFAALFGAMLNHPAIEVRTGVDARDLFSVSEGEIQWRGGRRWDVVLYTGCLDRLFGYAEGRLPYRTLRFDRAYLPRREGLSCLAVYYPGGEIPWTRRTDYGYLPDNRPVEGETLVVGERPAALEGEEDEPYYVVLTGESKARHRRYQERLERVPHLYGAGRLAEFRYYNMDAAVGRGLSAAEVIHRREGEKLR